MKSSVMELNILKASIIYCILMFVIHVVNADVTCTAGIFVAGSQGVVRCDFGIDARKDQHDFNVVSYDNEISHDSRKNLLVCNWNNKTLDCFVKAPGYLFDDRVDSTLTLVIPVVDKSMTGLYRCQLVPKPPNIQMHTCNLTVIETPSPEPTMRMPSETTTLTVNSRSSAESEAAVPATPFIVFSIVFFLVIVVLVLYIIFRRRILRKLGRFRTRPGQTGENHTVKDPEDIIALMVISRPVVYPKNTSHKQTQVFIDFTEKSTQFGNESGVTSDNKSTQLNLSDQKFGVFKASEGEVVLHGSSERFRNPIYSTLGTPLVQLPPKYENTEVSKRNNQLFANVSDDQPEQK